MIENDIDLGLFSTSLSNESYLNMVVNGALQWVHGANASLELLSKRLSNHIFQKQQGVKRRQPYHGSNESRTKYGVWSFALDPRIDCSDTPFSFLQSPRSCVLDFRLFE